MNDKKSKHSCCFMPISSLITAKFFESRKLITNPLELLVPLVCYNRRLLFLIFSND